MALPRFDAFFAFVVALLAAISTTGCGDRSSPVLHLEANGTLRISPSQVQVDDGGSIQLSAVFRDGVGRVVSELPPDASLSWKTFSSTVARVHGSGLQADLSALKPGRTTIQVALGSLTATADVNVRPVAASVVSVGAPVAQGKAGELVPTPPRVQVLDRHGSPVPGEIVRFTVAKGGGGVLQTTVRSDAFGFAQTDWLLGPDLGIQVVEAAVADLPATQLFSYVNGDLSSVTFSATSPGTNQGPAGQPLSDMLEVRARDAQGRPVMGVGVEWNTSHGTALPASPVTDSQGRARARWVLGSQAGSQTASVRLTLPEEVASHGGVPQDLLVQFQADAVAGTPVEVSALPERLVLELGGAARVNVVVLDGFGNRLADVGSGTWTFAENGIVDASASTSGDALFTANRIGTTRAVVQVGSLADTIDVVVRSVTGTGGGGQNPGAVLRLSPPDLSIDVGQTAGFSVLAEDGAGNPLPASDAVWSSDDPAVATVDAFGRVVGLSPGTTTIRASLYDVTASGTLQVRSDSGGSDPDGPPARIDDLRVVDSSTSWLEVAFTAADDGTGSTARHEIRFAPAPMGWEWGQATTVSSGPCASPLTPGFVGQTVVCRIEGLTAGRAYDFRMVTWREQNDQRVYSSLSNVARGSTDAAGSSGGVASVEVTPGAATLTVGSARSFEARAFDAQGQRVDDVSATWSTTNEAVAQVDGSGRVTAVGTGTASITATVAGRTGSAAVSVVGVDQPDPSIASVTVSPSSASVTVGQSLDLSASAWTSGGTRLEGTSFTWSTDDPFVATVDGSGRVTTVSAGTVTVRASAGGHSATSRIQVGSSGGGGTPVRVAMTPSSAALIPGGGVQLTARLLDAAGLDVPGASFSWQSGDPSVATVDANGFVRAVATGTAVVTVRASGLSATAQIVVTARSSGTAWFTETWPTIHGPGYEHTVPNPAAGDVSLLTGLTGTPGGFTNAMRVTYLGSFGGGEPTVGITLKMPLADVDKPREAWVELYARWSPNWSTSGPYCTGARDHKFFFIFQNDRIAHPFTFRSHIGIFGNQIGHYIDGSGPAFPGADALFDGAWHQIRYHAKIDRSNPEWDIWIDGTKYTWHDSDGINPTSDDVGNYLAYLVLSRNMNCGVAHDMTLDYGPVAVYITNPGW